MMTSENNSPVGYTTLARLDVGDQFQYPDDISNLWNTVVTVDRVEAQIEIKDGMFGYAQWINASDNISVIKKLPAGSVSNLTEEVLGRDKNGRDPKPVSRG